MSMEVKPIHPAPNFKVSSADETRDEERQKRDPRGSRDGKESKERQLFGKAIENKAAPAENKTESSLDNSSMSQLIDSKKVVELLSHRPQAQSRRRLAFQASKKVDVSPASPKKFDRSF